MKCVKVFAGALSVVKCWFKIQGQDGDRTLEQQLLGLDDGLAIARGKTVLDLGSAEGLIAKEFLLRGAKHATCVEIVKANADRAVLELKGLSSKVVNENVEKFVLTNNERYDVVLALAILHKLKDPAAVIDYVGRVTDRLAIIRLPAETPGFVRGARSNNVAVYVTPILEDNLLFLKYVRRGSFNEWIGYYSRV